MRVGATISAFLIAGVAVAATWWLTRPETPAAAVATSASTPVEEVKPSKTGPHPKVVLQESIHNFGVMKFGDSGTHTFVVRNEGEAPLKLGKPRTTCQCTVSEAAKNEIAPGDEGTITLDYKPSSPAENFDKGAFISTNDPKMPEITLAVVGRVDPLVIVEPKGDWFAGKIAGDVPMAVTGYLYSRILDDLKVESVESKDPRLKTETKPMSDEKLKEYEAKSGYEVVATVMPGMPIGGVSEPLTIVTNVEDKEFHSIEAKVTGTHQGPIEILPMPGTKWYADYMMVDLHRFPASRGATGKVSMFVSGMPEGESLAFEKIDSPIADIQLDLKRDENFKVNNRQKYDLKFTVVPGATPAVHRSSSTVVVKVATNHPTAKEMKFRVQYIAAP